jgi:hypothetical protein
MCMFAVVVLAWHPHDSLLVENGTEPEHFPPEYFAGVEEGVTDLVGSFPVRVVLVDGLYHEVDSSHRSFQMAAHLATRAALPKLPFASHTADPSTANEIALAWQRDRGEYLDSARLHLTEQLDSFSLDSGVWWRAHNEIEQLIRLSQNAPLVPTRVDLKLSISVPTLLDFLAVEETWRDRPERLPQEMAAKRLSNLGSTERLEINEQSGEALLQGLHKFGLPYLEEVSDIPSLLAAPGYIDKGTRSALYYLCQEYEQALQMAKDGLDNCIGFPRQRKYCEHVLQRLREKG